MDAPKRAEIVVAFDKAWQIASRTMRGPDGPAILRQVAAEQGVTYEEARAAVLDDMDQTAGTG